MATGSNMAKKNNWFFPVADGGTKYGLNDSGVETFLDDTLESLVRESIQNSLDAKNTYSNGPVLVEFRFDAISSDDIPGKDYLVNEYLPKIRKSWKIDDNEYQYTKDISSLLKKIKVPILCISDFNTTGLEDINWDSLIKETGVSNKADNDASGSKGIGKYAPFAASDLRMVFYNTKTSNIEKYIGVIQGISFYDDDNKDFVSQNRGFYAKNKNIPFDNQFSMINNRDKNGTDLIIIGVKEFENRDALIKLSILENFLLSIHTGTLEVKLEEEIVNKDNLSDILDNLLHLLTDEKINVRIKHVKKYLSLLENNNSNKFYLDMKVFNKYSFINDEADAELIVELTDSLNSTRSILRSRSSGMKIDEPRIRGGVFVTGIFQAKGKDLNIFLRTLESASHNKWVADRAVSDQKIAISFLRDLTKFQKDCINSLLNDDKREAIDAYGTSSILPDDEIEDKYDEEFGQVDNINNKINKINIKLPKTPKIVTNQFEKTETTDSAPGPGSGNGGSGGGTHTNVKFTNQVSDVQVNIVERDYENGKYTLKVSASKHIKNLKVKLLVNGEDGSYKLNISNLDGYSKNCSLINGDTVIFNEVEPDKLISVDWITNYNYRIKLKAEVYENN